MLQALLLYLALHKSGNLFLTALSDGNLNAGYFEKYCKVDIDVRISFGNAKHR